MNYEPQQRETRSGKKYTIKTRLTAREARDLLNIEMKFIKIGLEKSPDANGLLTNKPDIKDFDQQAALNAKADALVGGIVTEYDGSSENVLARILDGDFQDYSDVLKECEAVLNPPELAK